MEPDQSITLTGSVCKYSLMRKFLGIIGFGQDRNECQAPAGSPAQLSQLIYNANQSLHI